MALQDLSVLIAFASLHAGVESALLRMPFPIDRIFRLYRGIRLMERLTASQLASMNRRTFLRGTGALAGMGALGIAGCAKQVRTPASMAPALPIYDAYTPLVPIRAHADRLFRITVCLRPFRAAGPRMDVEKVGDKTVVHNYGHGGSGWSLSWGSATFQAKKAMEALDGSLDVAVLGAGAMGLTSATMLQRAGARVTIYAKERAPFTRSSRATGSWTPDSRVALASAVGPGFAADWEAMARASFFMYQSFYGMPGSPVEWTDRWMLSDTQPNQGQEGAPMPPGGHDFIRLNSRIADLTPRPIQMPQGSTPFPTKYVSRSSQMTFNVADYSRQLLTDFLIAGGKIETREFHAPQELTQLPQKVIVNCPGYGGRALWSDESITPVRGQIAWLIPQEDAHYGITYRGLSMLSRRDGIVMQYSKGGPEEGWNDANETPDRAYAEEGVAVLAELYSRMQSAKASA
jgi:glycine/D-amino acid oxidase-like deaminating enzyme